MKRGADVGSDHHLVSANIKLTLMNVPPKSLIRRIDTGKLKDNNVRQDFRLELKNSRTDFRSCNIMVMEVGKWLTRNGVEFANCSVKQAKKTLGFKRQVHKHWITTDTWKIIDKRKYLKAKLCNTHSERIK